MTSPSHTPSVHWPLRVRNMFDHLLKIESPTIDLPAEGFTTIAHAQPHEVISAQASTLDWLEEIGAPVDSPMDAQQKAAARSAFLAVTTGAPLPEEQKAALLKVKGPKAVQQLTAMLDAYDWEFVEQAKELRGYITAKILEETKHPDPKIRLRALQMLGNIAEVGLFEERVKITKVDATAEELEKRIRERLANWVPAAAQNQNVTDVELKELPGERPAAT